MHGHAFFYSYSYFLAFQKERRRSRVLDTDGMIPCLFLIKRVRGDASFECGVWGSDEKWQSKIAGTATLCRGMNGLCASTTKCTGALQDETRRTRNNEWKLESLEEVNRVIDRNNVCMGLQIERNACFMGHCVVDSSRFVIHYHWMENVGISERRSLRTTWTDSLHGVFLDREREETWVRGVWPCTEAEKTQHKLRGHFCHFVGLS